MTVVLLRHAESIYNATGDITIMNCGLTENGRKQASQLSGNFDLVLISPLRRTLETLDYSNIIYKHIRHCDLLRERIAVNCDRLNNNETFESEYGFNNRMSTLHDMINYYKTKYNSIIIITHFAVIYTITGGKQFKNAEAGLLAV